MRPGPGRPHLPLPADPSDLPPAARPGPPHPRGAGSSRWLVPAVTALVVVWTVTGLLWHVAGGAGAIALGGYLAVQAYRYSRRQHPPPGPPEA